MRVLLSSSISSFTITRPSSYFDLAICGSLMCAELNRVSGMVFICVFCYWSIVFSHIFGGKGWELGMLYIIYILFLWILFSPSNCELLGDVRVTFFTFIQLHSLFSFTNQPATNSFSQLPLFSSLTKSPTQFTIILNLPFTKYHTHITPHSIYLLNNAINLPFTQSPT